MNLNELRKKHEQLLKGKTGGGEDNGDKYLKIQDGKNTIRILPWKDDSKPFYAEAIIHRYFDEDNKLRNYYCRKMQNESCPVCDFYFDLWKMHKDLGLPPKTKSRYGDLATKIKGQPRYYMNVVDRRVMEGANADPANAIKILSTGQKVFKKVMDGIFNPDFLDESDPENTNVLALKKGNDFVLELGKSGEYNNYDQSTFRLKKTAAGSDREIKIWMEVMHDIHGLIEAGDYEEGKKIVQALGVSLDNSDAPSFKKDDDMGDSKFNKGLQA